MVKAESGFGDLTVKILVMMLAVLCTPAAVAGGSAALPIIVYHQIRDGTDGPADSLETISLERFGQQMDYLKRQGYMTLSAAEVVTFIKGGGSPSEKIVAIHFDDGWKSAQLALPVLDRHGFKATFWIIAGKGIGQPHMDWDEIQAIAANPRYGVYSHSMTHPWKDGDTMLDWMAGQAPEKGANLVRWELAESRRILTEKLNRPIPYLAWPGGHHNEDMIRIATAAGYIALFTVQRGLNGVGDDPLRIRRTMVHGGCDEDTFAQILSDGMYRDCSAPLAYRGNAGKPAD